MEPIHETPRGLRDHEAPAGQESHHLERKRDAFERQQAAGEQGKRRLARRVGTIPRLHPSRRQIRPFQDGVREDLDLVLLRGREPVPRLHVLGQDQRGIPPAHSDHRIGVAGEALGDGTQDLVCRSTPSQPGNQPPGRGDPATDGSVDEGRPDGARQRPHRVPG